MTIMYRLGKFYNNEVFLRPEFYHKKNSTFLIRFKNCSNTASLTNKMDSFDTVVAKAFIILPSVLIMLIYAIFHCLRLRYRESKASPIKLKCINLAMVSYLMIVPSISRRILASIAMFIFIFPASYYSTLFPGDDCTYYVFIQMEQSFLSKFAIHLFVTLRSRIAHINAEKTSIWFRIVCGSLFYN